MVPGFLDTGIMLVGGLPDHKHIHVAFFFSDLIHMPDWVGADKSINVNY